MSKKFLLSCLLTIVVNGWMNAQEWSKEDSIWLKSIIEGDEDIKINENTRKAIEEGLLVVPSWMKNAENEIKRIEILKNLRETEVPDSVRIQSIDPYSMPPAVFALYVLYMNKIDSINSSQTCMLTDKDRQKLEDFVPPETRIGAYVSSTTGGIGGLDFNHLLSMVFSPTYRRFAHNAKHATAYKNYYDEEAIRPISFTERERRQLRQSLRNIKVSSDIMPGQKKFNGIDN
ncbi:MAG: hypothetical protein LBL33_02850 [Tannerella sp.]|jgi:hypothetical protein|nr:hypothetical protein [Tannerella sp.]